MFRQKRNNNIHRQIYNSRVKEKKYLIKSLKKQFSHKFKFKVVKIVLAAFDDSYLYE